MRLSTLCLQASSCTYGTYGEAALEEVRIRSRSTGRLDRTIRPATRCGCSQYVDPPSEEGLTLSCHRERGVNGSGKSRTS